MKSGTLSADEMREFTDARMHERQREMLRDNRIPFAISAKGRPVTTWEAINRALSGGLDTGKTEVSGFNLSEAK